MMRDRLVRGLLLLCSQLAVRGDREPLVGDLLEEHAVRMRKVGTAQAFIWILRQVCMSAPALVRARLASVAWPSTLGVALLAWLAIAVVETLVNRATSAWLLVDDAYNPAAMFLTMPLVVAIAGIASRVRRHAAFALALLMLLAVASMTVSAHEVMPMWFRIAYFVVGPAASWMGAQLQARLWPRS